MAKKKPIDISKLKDAKTQFIKALNKVYDLELAAKIKAEGKGAELTKEEISDLRKHPDLGLWNSNGNPISIEGVRDHFRWRNKKSVHGKQTSPLTLKEVKPKELEGYTRPYLESQNSITREAQTWIDRLDGKDWWDSKRGKKITGTGKKLWPPGLTAKNIWNDIGKAATETGELNAKLAAETGFNFQKGHGWGVMGPTDNRTWVVPYYGNRMEGHFNFRNVAPQPSGPSTKQLQHKFWGSIIPNVPPAGSPYGVQISSAEELKLAGGGGQGWSGTMADILLSKIPNANIDDFDQLPLEQKAYVMFADPDKGGGATPEARYFEIKNGQWENVLRRLAPFAETGEKFDIKGNLINQARKIVKGSAEWWAVQKNLGGPTLFNLGTFPTMALMARGADLAEIFKPSQETEFKIHDKLFKGKDIPSSEIASDFASESLDTGKGIAATYALAGTANVLTKGAVMKGVSGLTPFGWGLFAISAADSFDNLFLRSAGKDFLREDLAPVWNAAKEGEALTSIPSDNTLGSSLQENKIGGNEMVKYQTQESTEWTTDLEVDEEPEPEYKYARTLPLGGA